MKIFFQTLTSLAIAFFAISCSLQKPTPKGETAVKTEKQVKEKSEKMIVTAINGKYLLLDTSSAKTYFKVDLSNLKAETDLKALDKIFNIQWSIVPETGIREKLKAGKIGFDAENLKRTPTGLEVIADISKPKGLQQGTLVIDFIDTETSVKYTYDLPIDFAGKRIQTRFAFFESPMANFPYFKSFVTTSQKLHLRTFIKNENPVTLVLQKNLSSGALSPMSTSRKDESQEYELIEKKDIKLDEAISFDQEGNYFLTQDVSNPVDALGFVVLNDRFPRLTKSEDLIKPLIYMSTPKEIESLKSNANTKEALDLYFLNLSGGDQKIAKNIISSYYKRVSMANTLFSNYKEGWKTDKGMVYIIMGPPDRVQKNRQKEIWQYTQNQNNSDIIFTFQKKNNKYITDHYELVRYPEYASFWYPYVELWRKGSILE
jgi:GWxTD domain-containing protein